MLYLRTIKLPGQTEGHDSILPMGTYMNLMCIAGSAKKKIKCFLSMGTAPNKRQYHPVAQFMQDEHSIKQQQHTSCCSHSPTTSVFKKRVRRFPCCTCKLHSQIPSHLKDETYTSLRSRLKVTGEKQKLALVRSVMYQATASQQEDGE